jgi:hypothetical protein
MSLMLAAVLACGARSEADAYARALATDAPLDEARASCRDAGVQRDACLAALVRARPLDAPGLLGMCGELEDPRWRGECTFAVAEARAQAGDRWGALEACAGEAGSGSGTFQDECLYHSWGFELQRLAEGKGRAVDAWPVMQDAVAYWSSIRTLQTDPREQLVQDAWFFAHARNRPARLADCAELPEGDRYGCERGTVAFVRRTVVEDVIRGKVPQRMLERACRGPAAARGVFGDFFEPDPVLDAAFAEAVTEVCTAPGDRGERADARRPWSPVFGARSRDPGPLPPEGGRGAERAPVGP